MRKVKEKLLIKFDLVLCAVFGIAYLILINVLNFKLEDPLIKNTLNSKKIGFHLY